MLRPTATKTFHLQCVTRIAAGIQQLEQRPFDVVLLDLNLPDSSGLDSFLRLYAHQSDVPIIVLTGIHEEQVRADTLRRGAQDFLIKGEINEDTLIRSIEYAIERNRRQQAERVILQTQLEERRRLARELHDGVIQSLSAMRLRLQMLDDERSRAGDPETAGTIRELANEALAAIQDVRLLACDLHPSVLDKHDLAKTLELFGKQLELQYGLAIEITNHCTRSFGDQIKHHLYRIVQECMRNAAKHARATRLRVVIREQDFLKTVEVQDDGIGFDEANISSSKNGLGLISMRERARLLGGSVHFQSKPGTGTTVRIEIPF
jgi:Amt family ammonium transporter